MIIDLTKKIAEMKKTEKAQYIETILSFKDFENMNVTDLRTIASVIEAYQKEKAILEKTSASRFRNPSDTNVWLFKYWQIASGQYAIGNPKLGGLFSLDNAGSEFWDLLNSGKYQIMCVNDGFNVQDEEQVMKEFINTLEKLLPEKSSFELL